MKFSIILIILLSFVNLSCTKKPEANFVIDKDTCVPGETIHLKNTSSDGYDLYWTCPDGTHPIKEEIDYSVSGNNLPDQVTFSLKAYSKNKKNTSSISHSVNIKQSTWSVGSNSYKAFSIMAFTDQKTWQLHTMSSDIDNYTCMLIFSGSKPTPGVYAVHYDYTSLQTGEVSVQMRKSMGSSVFYPNGTGYADSVTVSQSPISGKQNYRFSNILADEIRDSFLGIHDTVSLSGDITF